MNTIDRLTALLACLAATPCLATVLDVTDALKSDAVASVLAYGARHVRGEADGPDYIEGGWEEAFWLAPIVLRARIELDRRWASFTDPVEWGAVGNALLDVDAVLSPHADALRLVPGATWDAFEAEGETFDDGSWWGDVRVATLREWVSWGDRCANVVE